MGGSHSAPAAAAAAGLGPLLAAPAPAPAEASGACHALLAPAQLASPPPPAAAPVTVPATTAPAPPCTPTTSPAATPCKSAAVRPKDLNVSARYQRPTPARGGGSLPTPPTSPISPASPPPPPFGSGATSTPFSSAGSSSRRSFRSLLRSRSATQAVMQGEPRPSDVAPGGELLSEDMVELTVEGGGARYYNLTVPPAGRRRHSIGAFLARDRDARARAAALKVSAAASAVSADEEAASAAAAAAASASSGGRTHRAGSSSSQGSGQHCRSSHARRRCAKCSSEFIIVKSMATQTLAEYIVYSELLKKLLCLRQVSG
ncbi:nascent polypeptide-associated complex subunit alpha, muscle-specific form-like [Schistocerca americana]|uniref:nascent polypeptide-associated complex subunit alpha, muscle-specific form-like n=1 Tax=Schistocerca americana TaxID=7009 RepID=UPI001F4F1E2E|nr:nascent polypeptide-associated complex subunit alpha, muscle-specific form-like [Schistocerca americana]